MPELPEVQTTVNGLVEHLVGRTITAIWTDYNSPYFHGGDTIKDPAYFRHFARMVRGRTVTSARRRAKNILIGLDNGACILVHMKMTGHLLYGRYHFDKKATKDPWQPLEPEALKDPYNRHVHLVFTLDNGYHLALSDVRKFAKVTLIGKSDMATTMHLHGLGPEPLEPGFGRNEFVARLFLRPGGKIKQVLTDQTILAGIGNIYADESLWRAGIHPLSPVHAIPRAVLGKLFEAIQATLSRGINFGGDSTSDYRNIMGERGQFHETHRAYQRTGETCSKRGCPGIIRRIVVGARGTHYCDTHQICFGFKHDTVSA